MTKLLYAIIAAFMLVCLSCGDSTGPSGETYTVSGTLTKLDIADGIVGYAGLGTMMGPDSSFNVIYTCESSFTAGVASYSMSGVAAGTYYFGAMIDVNGNFNWDDGEPDQGDWVIGDFVEVTINQNTVINVSDDEWELWNGGGGDYDVWGNLYKNGVADGILGYVALADSNFTLQYISSTSFGGGSAYYTIWQVEEDSYQFAAFIDMNGNYDPSEPGPDEGDWVIDPYWVSIYEHTYIDVNDWEWSLHTGK